MERARSRAALKCCGLEEIAAARGREVAGGPDQAAELAEAEGQFALATVLGVGALPRLADELLDRLPRRRPDPAVGRDLLGAELREAHLVRGSVGHRRVEQHLVAATGDPRAKGGEDVREVLDVRGGDEDEVARNGVDPDRGAPPDWGLRPVIGNRFSCIAVRMCRWSWPRWGSSSMNSTPSCASWIAPGIVRSYGLRPELRMAAVRVVPDIAEELGLARPGRQDERRPIDLHEDLARALLLQLSAAVPASAGRGP